MTTIRHILGVDGPLSTLDVARGLQNDASVREQLTVAIASSPYPALFFECAPTSSRHTHFPFSYVLLPSPSLARMRSDPTPFGPHFSFSSPTATFSNLGADAMLVAPSPNNLPLPAGAHIAAFMRQAPQVRIDAFWAATGRAVESWLAHNPSTLWLSTSGLSVGWLHMRLDTRPKYYQHRPFRRPPPR